jgi:hypothetical protein
LTPLILSKTPVISVKQQPTCNQSIGDLVELYGPNQKKKTKALSPGKKPSLNLPPAAQNYRLTPNSKRQLQNPSVMVKGSCNQDDIAQ